MKNILQLKNILLFGNEKKLYNNILHLYIGTII